MIFFSNPVNFNSLYKIWWNRVSWIDWRKDKICWTIQGMGDILLGWKKSNSITITLQITPTTAISPWKRCCHRDLSLSPPRPMCLWRVVLPPRCTLLKSAMNPGVLACQAEPSREVTSKKYSLFSSYFSWFFPKNQPPQLWTIRRICKK